MPEQLVFVDESGCNRITTKREMAWSHLGNHACMRGYFVRGQGSIHTSAQWESHDRARSLQVHGGQTRYSDVGYFAGFSFVPQIAFDISWSIDMKLAVHSCHK